MARTAAAVRAGGGLSPVARISRPFLRYLAVGAVATAAHYLLLAGLVEQGGWPAPPAAAAGAVLGAQLAFVGNRRFTFGHAGPWWPAWMRFQLTALLGAATSAGMVALGTRVGLHYLLAQVAATGVAMVLTYVINKRWSFGG